MNYAFESLAVFNLTPVEIGAIVFVVLLLFGAKRLPELARGAAKAIKEFKTVSNEAQSTFKEAMKEEDKKAEPPVATSKE